MSEALFWNYKKIAERPLWVKIVLPLLLIVFVSFFQRIYLPDDSSLILYSLFISVLLLSACYGGAVSMLSASLITSFIILNNAFFNAVGRPERFFALSFVIESFAVTAIINTIESGFKRFNQKGAKFKKMVEQTGEAFVILNLHYMFTYHTAAVRTLLGYTQDELKGSCFINLIHPEDKDTFNYDLLKQNVFTEAETRWRGRLISAKRQYIWVEITVSDLLADAMINGVILHINNIDGQVKKELQKDDFVNIATHELKSPITVLKGYLQIFGKRLSNNPDAEADLKLVNKMDLQLNRVMALISDMLDATKIAAGELSHKFEVFDINDCIQNCADGVMASDPACTVHCHLTEGVLEVRGDRNRIHQVVNNFITNAIKYSPHNKNVEVRSRQDGNRVKIIVKDYGIGIPDEKLEKVFERFYRVDPQKGAFEGLGLGLYICAEIIKKHNGQIGANSKLTEGSEFWFSIPISKN